MERLLLVSSDSHCGLPAKEYRPYLDAQYRDALDYHIRDVEELQAGVLRLIGFPFGDDVLDVIDGRGVVRSGGARGAYDPERRIQEAEAEGVVAEVVHPGTMNFGPAPFFEVMVSRYPPELRAAGARGYNRWLSEFCAAAPGRLIGVALTEPWPDMQAAVTQVRQAREAGLGGLWTDQFAGLDDEAPGLWDRSWDPFWAACVEHDIVVHIHIGFGLAQGEMPRMMRDIAAVAETSGDVDLEAQGKFLDTLFPSRRPLWQLIWGGVFDRFPQLKVVFAEQHAGWLPATLHYLDAVHAQDGTGLRMKPSEYWRERNLAVTCTSMRPSDLIGRHEIGMDKVMFGTDFPHFEGTWPNTFDWLRVALNGIPEGEARKILGENAVRIYGLDGPRLRSIAEKVGPLPSEILGDGHVVDPQLIAEFDRRAGFSKDQLASYDEAELAAAVEDDVRRIELSRAS